MDSIVALCLFSTRCWRRSFVPQNWAIVDACVCVCSDVCYYTNASRCYCIRLSRLHISIVSIKAFLSPYSSSLCPLCHPTAGLRMSGNRHFMDRVLHRYTKKGIMKSIGNEMKRDGWTGYFHAFSLHSISAMVLSDHDNYHKSSGDVRTYRIGIMNHEWNRHHAAQ